MVASLSVTVCATAADGMTRAATARSTRKRFIEASTGGAKSNRWQEFYPSAPAGARTCVQDAPQRRYSLSGQHRRGHSAPALDLVRTVLVRLPLAVMLHSDGRPAVTMTPGRLGGLLGRRN